MAAVPIHPGLFTLPDDPRGPRLLAGRCPACGDHHFPAGDTCPYCGRDGCQIVAIGATGTLSLFTVVNARPPGYRGPVPYGFGIVDLPEGMRVVTRLSETRLERMRPGQPVALEIAPLFTNDDGDEVLSFAYGPSEDDAGAAGGERAR
ncbi:MAG TPA: OB-fold domain-containing protein [Candidatus Binatia bacterium]|nr:OB-fold domain-containing protein [Candidatus Binatia bacterium]